MPHHHIHLAAERGELAEVQRLITEDPALLELRGYYKDTPLLRAARHGHPERMKWLLDQGADREAQANGGWDAVLAKEVILQ